MHNLFFLSLSRGRVLAISHKLLCIRLSSLLCCEPRLPRTSGEAVTQGGPLPPPPPPPRCPSVTSEAADQEGFPLYPSPRLSEEPLPSLPRFRTLSTGEEGGKYTLSSLPCPHSCIQLHGAALMHFVHACVNASSLFRGFLSRKFFTFIPPSLPLEKGRIFDSRIIDEGIVFMNRINYIFIKQLIVINSNRTRTLFPRCIRRIILEIESGNSVRPIYIQIEKPVIDLEQLQIWQDEFVLGKWNQPSFLITLSLSLFLSESKFGKFLPSPLSLSLSARRA